MLVYLANARYTSDADLCVEGLWALGGVDMDCRGYIEARGNRILGSTLPSPVSA